MSELLYFLLTELIYLLRVISTPSCWVRNERTDRHWDRAVRRNLKQATFSELGRHTVKLNEKEIWIANHPYASVTNYRCKFGMPSRRTVFKFRDALEKHYSGI